MIAGLRPVAGGQRSDPSEFEVGYVDPDEGEVRRLFTDVLGVAFERVPPVRSFPSYKGQRNYPGLYWSTSVGGHVGVESWLERDEAMALDFDTTVTSFAPQPFWLFWPAAGRVRSHAPDFFARRVDGTSVVIDCRPAQRIKPRDAEAFTATETACEQVGWEYRLVSGHDPVWLANLRWLAGYRHPRNFQPAVAVRLLEVFASPGALMETAEQVGDPIAVLPVLYHLLWLQWLNVDLSIRLDAASIVARAAR